MDPLKQLNAMRLQEPLPTALDLSMGCRQIPGKASSVDALDLVKKTSRSDRNSGTNSRTAHGPESHIPKILKQGPSDGSHVDHPSRFSFESRHCSVPVHKHNSSPLLSRLPTVAQMLCPGPPSNTVIREDAGAGVEMEKGLTCRSRNTGVPVSQNTNTNTDTDAQVQTRRSSKRRNNALNGLGSQSQYIKAGCGGKYTTDTVMPKTATKGFLVPQDSASPAHSLHSSSSLSIISEDSSTHNPATVETLSSVCAFSDESSPWSVEYISSDDSDVIEVPVTNPTCSESTSSHLLAESITAENISHENQTQEPDLGDAMDDACHDNEPGLQNIAETLESSEVSSSSSSPSPSPSPSPTVLQESDLETDDFVSKSLPSTSEAENADVPKPPPSSSPSLSSSKNDPPSERAPPSKRRKRAKPGTKKKSPAKKQAKPAPRSKAAPAANKRKRKKSQKSGASTSMFPPEEPEIKLRYANHKEEKKEGKVDGFAPYVRMKLSTCTVVNFQEEDVDVKAKKSRQSSVSSAVAGTVPATSCLQLGRLSSDSRSQAGQLCCLCGRTANSIVLGDLHGPYYPCGAQTDTCSLPTANHSEGLLDGEEKSPADLLRERSCSPEAASDCGERWIHEDCSIWSAGVFLVKGKLYGLEEAVRLAQETECSFCCKAGATLGCFFKGCPNKYHFPCSLQAGCSFNEENFTIRCPKHKNKSPRTSLSRLHNR